MPARPFLGLAVLALAACSSPEEMGEEPDTRAEAGASASATARASGGGARVVEQEDDLFIFSQSWPAEVGAIPALASKLDREAQAVRRYMLEEARADRKMREGEDYPYHQHSYQEDWKVVAEIPGWLSLSKDFSTYTGGAHGMHGLESLVWNKHTGRGMDGVEMFAAPEVLEDALGDKLCDQLDAERLRRRGSEYAPDASDPFGACPGLDEATVLVGSSNGRTFDRIGIYFGPYVAGPYAEGEYELDFPVDAKVLDAVKPDYRAAFSIKR